MRGGGDGPTGIMPKLGVFASVLFLRKGKGFSLLVATKITATWSSRRREPHHVTVFYFHKTVKGKGEVGDREGEQSNSA